MGYHTSRKAWVPEAAVARIGATHQSLGLDSVSCDTEILILAFISQFVNPRSKNPWGGRGRPSNRRVSGRIAPRQGGRMTVKVLRQCARFRRRELLNLRHLRDPDPDTRLWTT
jgi:hypothetical protein